VEHVCAPGADHVPTAQAAQDVALAAFEAVPAAHGAQLVAPAVDEYVDAAQAAQPFQVVEAEPAAQRFDTEPLTDTISAIALPETASTTGAPALALTADVDTESAAKSARPADGAKAPMRTNVVVLMSETRALRPPTEAWPA